MAERIPPHDIEAEKSVLGALLISNEALSEVIEIINPTQFYKKEHQEIFTSVISLFNKNSKVDILTVCDELKQRKVLELVGGRAYIAMLTEGVPVVSNARDYARIVAEKAGLRRLIEAANAIEVKAYDASEKTDEILDFAEKGIFSIAQDGQNKNYESISTVIERNVAKIEEAQKMEGEVTGTPTGFADLDNLLSGLQPSDLVIVAARPGMGKTAFALNVAEQTALKGSSVLIFSLEMSNEQLGQRMLAMHSRVDMEKIKKGLIEDDDWDRIGESNDAFASMKISIDDSPGISILEIKNKCRRMKAEKGLDLVIIDYLQLMSSKGRVENRQQEISALSRNIKLLAKELDCTVMLLSQLSRAPEQRPNHTPMLSDLRESGSIEQDADIVIFLYRDDYYAELAGRESGEQIVKTGLCNVIVAKHRNGPTGKVELVWMDKYTRFSDKEINTY
ncbi:MAG: replicative DNA helicase [Peptostreptococcaceae bacterium]|nr:replicative DNA helicase [Peptostreptococcaceae bacterium]